MAIKIPLEDGEFEIEGQDQGSRPLYIVPEGRRDTTDVAEASGFTKMAVIAAIVVILLMLVLFIVVLTPGPVGLSVPLNASGNGALPSAVNGNGGAP